MLDSSGPDPAILDPERLRALRETDLLDSPPEASFDRLTELVRRVLSVPVSLVSLVDVDRQFFKAQCGLEEPWASERQTPLSHSFCQHVVATREPLVVECAPLHPLVRRNLAIRDLGVISYVGIPLTTPDGHVLGSLCAIDSATREWSEEDIAVLQSIAGPVMSEIAIRAQAKKIHRYATELQAANAAKDRFFSIVAHDLRNPLQTILGYSSAIAEACNQNPDSDLCHFASRLDAAAFGMGRALDSLLQWTLVQSGKIKYRPTHFSIDEPLEAAANLVIEQAEQKGVQLLPITTSDCTVRADSALVTCIAHNLLTNAIKFTPSGGHVLVQVDQVGPEVQVTVEDNGIGMPEEISSQLFRIDREVSRSGTDDEAGTGLGLIICRDLVELNGGSIWAESREGVGTKVCVSLPASNRENVLGPERTHPIADRGTIPGGFVSVGLSEVTGGAAL